MSVQKYGSDYCNEKSDRIMLYIPDLKGVLMRFSFQINYILICILEEVHDRAG